MLDDRHDHPAPNDQESNFEALEIMKLLNAGVTSGAGGRESRGKGGGQEDHKARRGRAAASRRAGLRTVRSCCPLQD
jgi:hypothetical protein